MFAQQCQIKNNQANIIKPRQNKNTMCKTNEQQNIERVLK